MPDALAKHDLALAKDGAALVFTYDTKADRTGITSLLADLSKQKIGFNDIETSERSLEDIFVTLVHQGEDT